MNDLRTLRARCAAGEAFRYLYFWGHTVSKDGRINKACFSQWFESPFELDGAIYRTAEHWMMAAKARLFGDDEALARIIATVDPREAKIIGRTVQHFEPGIWESQCRGLVTAGNLAKFGQNERIRDFLLETADAVIVEASPYDNIWGIGMKEDDPRAVHPDTWAGENLLGFVLMDVREKLLSG